MEITEEQFEKLRHIHHSIGLLYRESDQRSALFYATMNQFASVLADLKGGTIGNRPPRPGGEWPDELYEKWEALK